MLFKYFPNGAMIAFLGEIIFNERNPLVSCKLPQSTERRFPIASSEIAKTFYLPDELDKIDIKPRQRTDEVEVFWR